MKEPISAGLVALSVGAAFSLSGWFADRRIAAVLAVVRSFCAEVAVYYAARADGRIDDAEARRILDAADRLFVDLETAGRELAGDEIAPAPGRGDGSAR